jgi:hypothetical protein
VAHGEYQKKKFSSQKVEATEEVGALPHEFFNFLGGEPILHFFYCRSPSGILFPWLRMPEGYPCLSLSIIYFLIVFSGRMRCLSPHVFSKFRSKVTVKEHDRKDPGQPHDKEYDSGQDWNVGEDFFNEVIVCQSDQPPIQAAHDEKNKSDLVYHIHFSNFSKSHNNGQ